MTIVQMLEAVEEATHRARWWTPSWKVALWLVGAGEIPALQVRARTWRTREDGATEYGYSLRSCRIIRRRLHTALGTLASSDT